MGTVIHGDFFVHRQNDTRARDWKHSLPATTFEGGNNMHCIRLVKCNTRTKYDISSYYIPIGIILYILSFENVANLMWTIKEFSENVLTIMSDFQCSVKRFFIDVNHYLATIKSKWALKVQSELSPLEFRLEALWATSATWTHRLVSSCGRWKIICRSEQLND